MRMWLEKQMLMMDMMIRRSLKLRFDSLLSSFLSHVFSFVDYALDFYALYVLVL